jgi:uncharacterized repeat protein (TIGR03803 family)
VKNPNSSPSSSISLFPTCSLIRIVPLIVAALALSFPHAVDASAKEKPIVIFNARNGSNPLNGLLADGKGNLYGVASDGGSGNCSPHGCGVVFELSPASGGAWTEKTIYAFKGGTLDTDLPCTELLFDTQGNLFGGTCPDFSGHIGAIYELTPGTGNTWSEKVVYPFTSQAYFPGPRLAFDSQGRLYGSAYRTTNGGGGVFQLSPQSNGTWTETILHEFNLNNGDGYYPRGGVILDSAGNIYGTTTSGGKTLSGTVFELTPKAGGGYSESIILNFSGSGNGYSPSTPLIMDAQGNLFGTTQNGGAHNNEGIVFELSPTATKWTETVLYSFGPQPDGFSPTGIVLGGQGILYGTTANGGNGCDFVGCGIVYQLTPQKSGPWKETILYNFESAGDGSRPAAGVVLSGTPTAIYGTTEFGGSRYGFGTVFEITP